MIRFLKWLLRLLSFGLIGREPSSSPGGERDTAPSSGSAPQTKAIVSLLVFPALTEDPRFDTAVEVGDDRYYVSSPWGLSMARVNDAIRYAEDWLATALGTRIGWNPVVLVNSRKNLAEWRSRNISLIREEVEELGLPWTDDHIYLAFVRGMGGYAGGIRYENGNAGYAMVGDVCLEAICEYPSPTAGSVVLDGWPANSFSLTGQRGAFIHEALHGLDLPHPDGWPEWDRPEWDETLMGHWWNMPDFRNTNGLTQREIDRVLRWTST